MTASHCAEGVLFRHFSPIYGDAQQTRSGEFEVEIYNPDDSMVEPATARSMKSYADAIVQLARQYPNLVEVPLDRPHSCFMQLRRYLD